MKPAIIEHRQTRRIHAVAPPHDRTTRAEKALTTCKDAWSHAYETALEKNLVGNKALRMAAVAYKMAMPPMDTLHGIQAAIACIAQGINLEVFDGRDGSQLLYAAQVALALLKKKAPKKQ